MVAEAAHSWADAGNEIFLLIADRRGARPKDDRHPLGFGRRAFVWALIAAFGIFTAGAVVSVVPGLQARRAHAPVEAPVAGDVALADASVLDGVSVVPALPRSRRVAGERAPW